MADGMTLEEALAAGAKPAPSEGLTLEQAMAMGAKPPEPSLYDRFVEGAKGLGRTVKSTGTALKDAAVFQAGEIARIAGDPGAYLEALGNDPGGTLFPRQDQGRQFLRGLSDTVTLGLAERLAKKADPGFAARAEQSEKVAPNERALGQVTGSFIPGATSYVARNVAPVAGAFGSRVLPNATGVLPGAARGVISGVAGYELAAPVLAAGQAASAGENPIQAARQASTDPFGLVTSAVGGAVTGAARGKAEALRDPSTLEGRTVRDVEAAGGRIQKFGKPARGGLFETPEVSKLDEGRAGVNQAAGRAQKAITAANREKLAQARQEFGRSVDQILAENGDTQHIMSETSDLLASLEKQNQTSVGKVLNKKLSGVIREVRGLLGEEKGLEGEVSAPAVPVGDMIKVKQYVNDMADWKARPDKFNRPYRLISKAIDNDANAVDPRIREMNAKYKAALTPLEESNDILFGKAKPDINISAAKRKSAALKIGRVGDETQAGTTDDLERLAALDPSHARELRVVRAKKAMERLRFRAGDVSTSIEKGMGQAALNAVPTIVGGAVGGVPGAVVGAGVGRMLSNPLALKLRLGLPVADRLASMGDRHGTLAARLFLARQRKLDQDAERASAFGGP